MFQALKKHCCTKKKKKRGKNVFISLCWPIKNSIVSFQTQTQSLVCISVRASLAVDDLYRRDRCLLQSNYHPKCPGRRVVQREIMCLLWTLMIQWKQTNDPPRVSHWVQWLYHSLSMKNLEKSLLNSFLFPGDGERNTLRAGSTRGNYWLVKLWSEEV